MPQGSGEDHLLWTWADLMSQQAAEVAASQSMTVTTNENVSVSQTELDYAIAQAGNDEWLQYKKCQLWRHEEMNLFYQCTQDAVNNYALDHYGGEVRSYPRWKEANEHCQARVDWMQDCPFNNGTEPAVYPSDPSEPEYPPITPAPVEPPTPIVYPSDPSEPEPPTEPDEQGPAYGGAPVNPDPDLQPIFRYGTTEPFTGGSPQCGDEGDIPDFGSGYCGWILTDDNDPTICYNSIALEFTQTTYSTTHWVGWHVTNNPAPTDWMRWSGYVQWLGGVPTASYELGIMIYGQLTNDWIEGMQPNEWRWISVVRPVIPGGDGDRIRFLMNSAPDGQVIRLGSVHLELFDALPTPMPQPYFTPPAIPDGYLLGDTWYSVVPGQWVGEIDTATDWVFECDLKLGDMNYEFGSLIRFTATTGNWGSYGDEILNLDITSWNELFVASDTVAYPDIYQWTDPLDIGQTMHVKIELAGPKREVWIDGVSVLVVHDMGPRESHQAVQVWSGDGFEVAADAKLKNVRWENLAPQAPADIELSETDVPDGPQPDPNATWDVGAWNSGGYMLGDSWYAIQSANLIGTIETAEDWEFEADLWLGDNWSFSTVIRFTVTDGNWGTYGDEILNIDVTSWNEIFLASDTLGYPDIYEWTSEQPVHQALHLKVTLHDNVREVLING